MFANIGYTEIGIILVVLLVLFGGSQLPKIARNLGESGKELKKANKDLKGALSEKS
jgi:sec-independent protein translocase protein TatA